MAKAYGIEYKEYRKGVYFDGHERDDVMEYRKEFLAKIKELVSICNEYGWFCIQSTLVIRTTFVPLCFFEKNVIITSGIYSQLWL